MKKILVSGLINIETSINVDSFPIYYSPIDYSFFKCKSVVSGVGYNVTKALKTLGDKVDLITEIGDDLNGEIILNELKRSGISTKKVIKYNDKETAESVVLVDSNGQRKIYCDLKDIQDREPLDESLIDNDYSIAILTNINFNRTLLKVCKEKGITIATDVHVLSDICDSYNSDFMKMANILFLSNEGILGHEGEFVKSLYNRYHNDIIVMGCGSEGALMYIGKEDKYYYEPGVAPRGIISTLGAGDALFSAFIHFYNKDKPLDYCLKKAVLFAGIKISQSGGSTGFVSEEELI